MTGRYKAYPEYKDSGVEWLGDVPEPWQVTKLKYLIKALESGVSVNAADYPKQSGELGVLKTSCVYTREFRENENKTVFEEEISRLKCPVRFGSIIISRMNTPDLVGAAAYVDVEDQDLYLPDRLWQTVFFNQETQNSKYVHYFMYLRGFRDQISNGAEGASSSMQNIAQEDFLSINILLPTFAEQQQIAEFLEYETAKIDTLITKQEQLIELLKEKRQAVISHAVTKGLNPNAPMKDSGVEWLGQVPEHWVVLSFGLTNKTAVLGGNYEAGEGEDGPPLIKMGNLGRGGIVLNKIEYLPVEHEYDKSYILKNGDFLFNTRNSLDLVGKVAIWNSELPLAIYNSNILRIYFYDKLVSSSKYMSYLFNSDLGLSQLRMVAKGTTSVAAVYYKELKSILLPLPPVEEQTKIVEFVAQELPRMDVLIDKAERAIVLIKERKTALISAAVTGKIDVRQSYKQ